MNESNKHRKKFHQKVVVGVITALILFAAATWVLLPRLLSQAIVTLLAPQGLKSLTIEIVLPTFNDLRLGGVSFAFQSNAAPIVGEIKALDLAYDFSTAKRFSINQITLSDAQIELPDQAAGVSESTASGENTLCAQLENLPPVPLNLRNVRILRSRESLLVVEDAKLQFGPETRLKIAFSTPVVSGTTDATLDLKTGKLTANAVLNAFAQTGVNVALEGNACGKKLTAKAAFENPVFGKAVRATLVHGLQTGRSDIKLSATELKLPQSPIPLTDFIAQLSVQRELVSIRSAQVGLLGGKFKALPNTFKLGQLPTKVPLAFDGIDLQRLLELYPLESLSGSGLLDGKFVVKRGAGGISISKGSLEAAAPGGVIKYKMAKTAQFSGLEALEDFHYKVLEAPFTLDKDGSLNIKLKLQGNNPNWQKGRAVELNINLEENLYKLLESLRLARGEGIGR